MFLGHGITEAQLRGQLWYLGSYKVGCYSVRGCYKSRVRLLQEHSDMDWPHGALQWCDRTV